MRERVIEMHRILKPTGSIYLHCDHHASHYLKVMMDEIFGASNFLNEIVWHYRKWSNKTYRFQRNHDILLFYSRSGSRDRTFNQQYMERAASTLKRFGTSKIVSGFDESGNRVPSQMAEEESEGVGMDDVWEIGRVAPVNQLYPTEKPEALLERVLTASSNRGDVVLDPFCGCGTTIAVAERLRRQWVGIDISPTAVNLIKKRVEKAGATNIKLVGMPVTETDLKTLKPLEFQNWVIQRLNGSYSRRGGDMGIDGFSFMYHYPIQVKQSESVGRPVLDAFEAAIERTGKERGYVVAFSFTKGAHEEVARVKRAKGLEIELVRVADLLEDVSELVTPGTGQLLQELPLPKGRPKAARPSVEELIESDQTENGVDEESEDEN
jgi:DNA modification methylase